jgi:uncharacterized protein
MNKIQFPRKPNPDYFIEKLSLVRHPEGGYFCEVYRSVERLLQADLPDRYSNDRSFGTSIYYLLENGDYSAFHNVKSDETWHFYAGSTLILHMIDTKGFYKSVTLGNQIEKGEVFQFTIPALTIFAAESSGSESYSLCGCTVCPGFDYEDFILYDRDSLVQKYPAHEILIHKFTRR